VLRLLKKSEANVLVSTYERYPVLMKRGRGVYLYDSEGKRYLDFLSGIGVNALGYSHSGDHEGADPAEPQADSYVESLLSRLPK